MHEWVHDPHQQLTRGPEGVGTGCGADTLLASAAPAEGLTSWLRFNLARATTYRGLAASVMITLLDEGSDLFTACKEMRAAGAALVARAQATGALRGDVDLRDLLLLVHGIAWASEQAAQSPERAERLLTLTLEGLRADLASDAAGPHRARASTVSGDSSQSAVSGASRS